MNERLKRLSEVLDAFNTVQEAITELDIQNALMPLRKDAIDKQEELEFAITAELMAFDFMENYRSEDSGWGTYFGPMIVVPNEQGQRVESPSIHQVTPEMLRYWSKRALEAKHPVLKARYAGLVWEFSKKVTGKSAPVQMAHIVTDASIEIASRRVYKYDTRIIDKLSHAMTLCVSINDHERTKTLCDTILTFESDVAVDDKLGSWGFSFDILCDSSNISLREDQRTKIIADLEARLVRISDPSNIGQRGPFAAEAVTMRLARYYRKKAQPNDVRRVLLKYGEVVEKMGQAVAPVLAFFWLQKLHSVYLEYGLRPSADEIAIRLRELGPKVQSQMISTVHEFAIPEAELNRFVEVMTEGNFRETLERITQHFIPRKDKIVQSLREDSQKFITEFLFTKQIQGHKGQPVANVGTLENDLDGNIVFRMGQNMHIEQIVLQPVIARLIEQYPDCATLVHDYICLCPIFSEEKRPIVLAALDAYMKHDYLVSMHLLIPQMEDAIRNAVEMLKGSVYKPGRNGGLFLKTLDELLRDEKIITLFGEDKSLYFRVLLTDQRGWNLRNVVCHGICPPAVFSAPSADRLFHVLLCLSHVRATTIEPPGEAESKT